MNAATGEIFYLCAEENPALLGRFSPGSPRLAEFFADLSRYIRAYQSGLDSALFPLGITLSLIFIGRNLVS